MQLRTFQSNSISKAMECLEACECEKEVGAFNKLLIGYLDVIHTQEYRVLCNTINKS
jgi:hypothetical protein